MSRMLEALRQIESRTQPLPCPSPAQWPGQADFTPGGDHSESTPAMGDAMDLSQQMWQQVETALAAETPVLPLPLPADAADWPVPDAASRPAPPPSDAAPPAETAATTDPYGAMAGAVMAQLSPADATLLFTSAGPGEEKTATVARLAAALADARFRPGPGHRRQPSRAGAGGPPGGAIDHRPGGRPRRHSLVERRRPADGHARAERLARRNLCRQQSRRPTGPRWDGCWPNSATITAWCWSMRPRCCMPRRRPWRPRATPPTWWCGWARPRGGQSLRRPPPSGSVRAVCAARSWSVEDRPAARSRNVYQPKRSTNSGASA